MLIIGGIIAYLIIAGVVGKLSFNNTARENAKYIGHTRQISKSYDGRHEQKVTVDAYDHEMSGERFISFMIGIGWAPYFSLGLLAIVVSFIFKSKPHQRNLIRKKEIAELESALKVEVDKENIKAIKARIEGLKE